MEVEQEPSFARTFPWILVVASVIGLLCSLVLVHDQIAIWQNPAYQPTCSLNPVISCGSVINSKQGHLFGLPAPFFGLVTFPALLTVGMVLLAGARLRRWFWLALEAGAIGGVLFALWLFWLSVYRVHALCPFCLGTDVAVYTVAWYSTLYNAEQGFIQIFRRAKGIDSFARRHHLDLLIAWLLIIVIFILYHFWYYYGKLL